MVPLLIQILAVVTLALVVRAVLRRLGVELGFAQITALAVILFLVQPAVVNMRNAWLRVDKQREANSSLAGRPTAAQAACLGVGVDPHFLSFLGSRVPVGEKFYMDTESMRGVGEFCIRFLLLPRLEVERPDEARYLGFWDPYSREPIEAAKRQGLKVTNWDRTKALAERP